MSHAALMRACTHQERHMFRTAFVITTVLAALALPAEAADVMVGHLKISAPWARATPKGASVGGAYMQISNTGNTPDRLVGGATAVAKEVQIHEMKMVNGVMEMRRIAGGLDVKPGQTVTLKPGGYHVMLIGLNQHLKKGQHFKVMLAFEKAGKVDVDFTVAGIGAQSSGAMPGMSLGMQMKH
jgi:copper(I)-binding protein